MDAPIEYSAFRVAVEDAGVQRAVESLPTWSLPEADVTVRVEYSSLNYKDALSASGNRGVSRHYPHTPGIDAAGTVIASADPLYPVGTAVICTGFDLGMNTPGGFAQLIRVPGEWLVPLPAGLSSRSAMVIGTAGLTAALALDRLHTVGAGPSLGPFVVTGASGGVGSLATLLLHRAGYTAVASTGKERAHRFLTDLGASRVIGREELSRPSAKQLQRAAYGGGVDTVGGTTLVNLINSTVQGGAVAACGLVSGIELPANIYPFILRGVALLGVDSQGASLPIRERIWRSLAAIWSEGGFDALLPAVTEVSLHELDPMIEKILTGQVLGRVVVRID